MGFAGRILLFGPKTEKSSQVSPPAEPPPGKPKPKRRGHGGRGTAQYTGARRVPVCHPKLKAGQECEKCRRGKLRRQKRPGVAMQLRGSPPVTATVWELEKLRCDGCGALFTAPLPAEAGTEKFDVSVGPTVGLLRYGCGLPHYRLARLQESLGVPLRPQQCVQSNRVNQLQLGLHRFRLNEVGRRDTSEEQDEALLQT